MKTQTKIGYRKRKNKHVRFDGYALEVNKLRPSLVCYPLEVVKACVLFHEFQVTELRSIPTRKALQLSKKHIQKYLQST